MTPYMYQVGNVEARQSAFAQLKASYTFPRSHGGIHVMATGSGRHAAAGYTCMATGSGRHAAAKSAQSASFRVASLISCFSMLDGNRVG